MYARTKRCYNERDSRTNYVRSSIPYLVTVDGTQAYNRRRWDVLFLTTGKRFYWGEGGGLIVLSYPCKLRACQFMFTSLITLTDWQKQQF
jgi:hypothetical protein